MKGLIRLFTNFFRTPTLTDAEKTLEKRRQMILNSQAKAFLNPLWQIEVIHKNKTLIKMPFSFLVHTHLKDYGFDPDALTINSPVIILKVGPNADAKIPLYIKELPDELK